MVNINSNYAASFAANAAKRTTSALDSAMERLSTGKRINYARDDAAGQAIATRLTAEIQGLAAASRNASDAQSMVDTADGAIKEIQTLLLRMRELAVQASNGTLEGFDRGALDAEATALESEITRIANNTKWAGIGLMDGTREYGGIYFEGYESNWQLAIFHTIPPMTFSALGGLMLTGFASVQIFSTGSGVDTVTNARVYISSVDMALSYVSGQRTDLAAVSNRIDSFVSNLSEVRTQLASSKGRIEDADFAVETANLTRTQILQQAGIAILAQANAIPQQVLNLLSK